VLEYIGALIMIGLAAGISALMIVAHRFLGGRAPTPVKQEPFECGQAPFQLPQGRMSVQFYLIAILFIIFDIEILFLFPWAVLYRRLGLFGLIEMGIFVFFLLVGYLYALKRGALDPG